MSFGIGGHMGNPNPLKQQYRCYTCGEPRPPYQFYCERHQEAGSLTDRPTLVDRFMNRLLGHGRKRPDKSSA